MAKHHKDEVPQARLPGRGEGCGAQSAFFKNPTSRKILGSFESGEKMARTLRRRLGGRSPGNVEFWWFYVLRTCGGGGRGGGGVPRDRSFKDLVPKRVSLAL